MRITFFTSISVLAAALLTPQTKGSPQSDACLALVPAPVQKALATQFPAYRLPVQTDNLPEDISYSREHGGSGCLGLAAGDFYGRGHPDYALLLTSRTSDDTVLVVATLARGSWRVQRLRNWGARRVRIYVDTAPKGTHVRTESHDEPVDEPGELARYTSERPCVLSGVLEASGVTYCYTGKRWVHVWVSD